MGYLEDKQALQQYMGDPGNADSPLTVLLHKLNGSVGADDGSGGSTTLTEIRDQLKKMNGGSKLLPVPASSSGVSQIGSFCGISATNTSITISSITGTSYDASFGGLVLAVGQFIPFPEPVTAITITIPTGSFALLYEE